jgi:phosphoribosylformylglycinamidine cyclo-ligase
MGMTYKQAGVDVEAGYRAVELIKRHAAKTFNTQVLSDIGGFGGMFALDTADVNEPVLVAGTDGVGTKLQIAHLADKHDTIGQDCVAMCVNDIVCHGARPLFFLDYIATGKMDPGKVASIVKGVSDGCISAGCALIGGETAEMPGFYDENEYDIAGFAVGIVQKSKIISGRNITEGDELIGIESSGLHSNGYSLVRKLLAQNSSILHSAFGPSDCTFLEEILKPTRIYVDGILHVLKEYPVEGIAHITGGGFIENIPRMIPDGLKAEVFKGSWPIKAIFKLIADWGDVDEKEMFNTFNMGIGMAMVVKPDLTKHIMKILNSRGFQTHIIGKITKGNSGVEFVS